MSATMKPRIHNILTELRRRLKQIYGSRLVKLVLYGSQARGDAVDESDIDVLVVLNGPVDIGEEIGRTGGAVASISLENDCLVSCAFVGDGDFTNGAAPFLQNVRREGVAI